MAKVKSFHFVDVFSGAGGISCGFEQAGHKCLLGIDHDKHAIKTFENNHPHASVWSDDVAILKKKDLEELVGNNRIDVVVGGPPCQGFSTVGTGNPNDKRNSLFLFYLNVVKWLDPKFIVIENVTGLLAKKNEKTLQEIFKKFSRIGYRLECKVVSAQQYGVPEKRRRTIILGTRLPINLSFPKETHDVEIEGRYIPPVTIGQAFASLQDEEGNLHNHDLSQAEIKNKLDLKRLRRIPEGKGIRYKKDEDLYLTPSTKMGVDWKTLPEGRFRQTKYQRLCSKSPSPTIMTHRHTYFHPNEDRYLTVREAAKIQSFPNNFVFHGPISAQWRQIGNAVPPKLAEQIAKHLYKLYANSTKSSQKLSSKKIDSKLNEIRSKAFNYKSN